MNHSNMEPKTKRSQLVLDVGLAPRDRKKRFTNSTKKKVAAFIFHEELFSARPPNLHHNATNLSSI